MAIPSAYLSMRRGLIAFALVWQGAWLFADPQLWPTNVNSAMEGLLLVGSWATWLLILILMLTSRARKRIGLALEVVIAANLLFVIGAAVALALNSSGAGENEWFLAASVFNLAAGICGIMIRRPWQWPTVVLIVSLEAAIFLSLDFFEPEGPGIDSSILYSFYALAAGVATASVQRMLLRRASEVDAVQQQSLRQAVAVKTASEVDAHIRSLKQKIHETVLNTLTAISRGSLRDSEESRRMVRERSAESAFLLSDLSPPIVPHPVQEVGGMIEQLRDLLIECSERGIGVRVMGDIESMPPDQVVSDMVASAREAVINALRHSGLTEIVIRIDRGRQFKIEISDNGTGFNPQGASQGFGLSSVLKSNSNLSIEIESETSTGSTVRIGAIKSETSNRDDGGIHRIPMLPFVLPTLSAWFAFSLLSVILTWYQFESPAYNVLALLVFACVAVIVIQQSRTGGLGPAIIFVGSVGAVLIYYLGEQSGPMVGTPWTEWSSEAIGVFFLVLAATGPWWGWIVVGSVWLLIQQNFPQEFVAPGFLLIMAGAFLGMQLRRTDRARTLALTSARADAVTLALGEVLTSSQVEKQLGLVPENVIDVLVGISNGSLDPWSTSVQRECGIAESHLRRTIFGGRTIVDPIARLAENLSQRALSLGLLLDVSLDERFPRDCELGEIGGFLQAVMESLPREATARFSATREEGRGVLRLVTHTAGSMSDSASHGLYERAPWGSCTVLTHESGSCEFLWEGTLGQEND